MKHSDIHTIAFMTNERPWTPTLARKWLKLHGLVPIKKMRIEGNQLRYRIRDPELFKSFITKKTNDGINLIIGIY
jgi:hypothetical protein